MLKTQNTNSMTVGPTCVCYNSKTPESTYSKRASGDHRTQIMVVTLNNSQSVWSCSTFKDKPLINFSLNSLGFQQREGCLYKWVLKTR